MEQILAFIVNHWLLWSGLIIVLFLLIAYEYSARYGGAARVSAAQAVQLMNKSAALVLDIRGAEAFEQKHIQGAKNIEAKSLGEQLKKLTSHKTRPIIIVDDMGIGAATAAKLLIDNQYSDCHVLQGGLQAWVEAGLPVVSARKKNKASTTPKSKASKAQTAKRERSNG